MHFPLLIVLICTFPRCVALVEPVTGLTFIGGALLSGFFASFNTIKCQFKECCTDKWVRLNATGKNKTDQKFNIGVCQHTT